MLDAVLHQRLHRQRQDRAGPRLRRHLESIRQPLPEPCFLNLQVVADDLELAGERHGGATRRVERRTKQTGQTLHRALGALGVLVDQLRDRIESVEEEVRMQARLERGQPCLQRHLPVALALQLLRSQLEGERVEPHPLGFVERHGDADDRGDERIQLEAGHEALRQ